MVYLPVKFTGFFKSDFRLYADFFRSFRDLIALLP
jgi:hypothetical protein